MHNLEHIIYSDEQETHIVRLADVKQVIEAHTGFSIIELIPGQRDTIEHVTEVFPFPKGNPTAFWWFAVAFSSPEGERKSLVLVALYGQTLQVITHDPLALSFFGEDLRRRAKEGVPQLTLEYIEQLEVIVRQGYMLWKELNDVHAQNLPGLRGHMYYFYVESRKVGHLLPGGPPRLGMSKVYLPDWKAKFPDQYITGDDVPP
jgi:hypothetical protein